MHFTISLVISITKPILHCSDSYNGTVEIFPLYEPASSSDKITSIGNLTLEGGRDAGINVTLLLHAVKGGHVTIYFNATPLNATSQEIKYNIDGIF